MYQPLLPMGYARPVVTQETRGVVYTREWVVDLLLDLAGYHAQTNLVDAIAVEPAAGQGAFLIRMVRRLVTSCRLQNRPLDDCKKSLIAYEIDEASVVAARRAVGKVLRESGCGPDLTELLVSTWVRLGDFLFEANHLPRVDFVIGNPPYVRLEQIPEETASLYRKAYSTMRGRADLYVAFFEAALRRLTGSGVCAFICADRWMLNQYGAGLRNLVTQGFAVETIVEMHNAAAFDDDVTAYPAITVIRRGPQQRVVVASAGPGVAAADGAQLLAALRHAQSGLLGSLPDGLTAEVVDTWFTGSDPWPCSSPPRLALLRRLEDRFEPLESAATGTKVGIGVATGLDQCFITKEEMLVESSRLLPLALARDTVTGRFQWSGHYLVNPWDTDGLVDLRDFPRLRAYLDRHREQIQHRNTAQRNPDSWYRTIDRVNIGLTRQKKLLIPDIKNQFEPVLDPGEAYPHHNLYYILSDCWDLEVLGGLLLSAIGQLFVEAYGVRMRGGYLRFQAQYLRRVRVPQPGTLGQSQVEGLIQAFRQRDRLLATSIALDVHGVSRSELDRANRP